MQSACELLGLGPAYGANEGKAVIFVAPEGADKVLSTLRAHLLGADAARSDLITEHKHTLVARTAIGANQVIPMQIGERLSRHC